MNKELNCCFKFFKPLNILLFADKKVILLLQKITTSIWKRTQRSLSEAVLPIQQKMAGKIWA